MTTDFLDQIDELVAKAPKGKRRTHRDCGCGEGPVCAEWEIKRIVLFPDGVEMVAPTPRDAALIAALDPDTVRELVALARKGLDR